MPILQGQPIDTSRINPLAQLMAAGVQTLQQGYQTASNRLTANNQITTGFMRDAMSERISRESQKLQREKMNNDLMMQDKRLNQADRFHASEQASRAADRASRERIAGMRASSSRGAGGFGKPGISSDALNMAFDALDGGRDPVGGGSGVLPPINDGLGEPPVGFGVQPVAGEAGPPQIDLQSGTTATAPGIPGLSTGQIQQLQSDPEVQGVQQSTLNNASRLADDVAAESERRDVTTTSGQDAVLRSYEAQKTVAEAKALAYLQGGGTIAQVFGSMSDIGTLNTKIEVYKRERGAESFVGTSAVNANQIYEHRFNPTDAITGVGGSTQDDVDAMIKGSPEKADTLGALLISSSELEANISTVRPTAESLSVMIDGLLPIFNRLKRQEADVTILANTGESAGDKASSVAYVEQLMATDPMAQKIYKAMDIYQSAFNAEIEGRAPEMTVADAAKSREGLVLARARLMGEAVSTKTKVRRLSDQMMDVSGWKSLEIGQITKHFKYGDGKTNRDAKTEFFSLLDRYNEATEDLSKFDTKLAGIQEAMRSIDNYNTVPDLMLRGSASQKTMSRASRGGRVSPKATSSTEAKEAAATRAASPPPAKKPAQTKAQAEAEAAAKLNVNIFRGIE